MRVWRIDGALIYSTAQKDDTSVIAGGDRWIEQALGGQTVSVLSSTGTYHDGLKRPNEELFQTFVPIRLSSDAQVDAVAEIDQRYSAIHNEAFKIWRPVQLLVLLLLVGVSALFVRWVRNAPAPQELGPPPERRLGPGRRADDLNVRDAAARADRAERLAEESRKRLEELEATVAATPSTATANAALEELDLKLRASEAECEELAGTVRRIQATLAEKEAELALAREGSEGTRAETKRANKLIAEAESRVTAAEKKAAAAEKKAEDAGKRATVTAERALEMEAQLSEAEQRATDAQAKASIENARRADVVELQRAHGAVRQQRRWSCPTRPASSGRRRLRSRSSSGRAGAGPSGRTRRRENPLPCRATSPASIATPAPRRPPTRSRRSARSGMGDRRTGGRPRAPTPSPWPRRSPSPRVSRSASGCRGPRRPGDGSAESGRERLGRPGRRRDAEVP